MKIALACDHGAYDLKETIKAHLTEKGYEVKDFGCFDKTELRLSRLCRACGESCCLRRM